MNVEALLGLIAGIQPAEAGAPTCVDTQEFENALVGAMGGFSPPGDPPPPLTEVEGERGESNTQWPNAAMNEMDPNPAGTLALMQASFPAAVGASELVSRPVSNDMALNAIQVSAPSLEGAAPTQALRTGDAEIVDGQRLVYAEDALSRGSGPLETPTLELPTETAEVKTTPEAPANQINLLNQKPDTKAIATEVDAKSEESALEAVSDSESEEKSTKSKKPQLESEPERTESQPQHQAKGSESQSRQEGHPPRDHQRDAKAREIVEDRRELLNIQRQGVKIELDVRELGSLSLEIEQTGGSVSAKVSAENDQVRQALASAQPLLTKALDDKGLVMKDFSVNAGLGDPHQRQSNSQERGQQAPLALFSRPEIGAAPKTGFLRSTQGLDLSA